jgi:hypothetical protein
MKDGGQGRAECCSLLRSSVRLLFQQPPEQALPCVQMAAAALAPACLPVVLCINNIEQALLQVG